MEILGEALRRLFVPRREYESLRDEDKASLCLPKPLLLAIAFLLWLAIFICTAVSLKIVFPGSSGRRLFCGESKLNLPPLTAADTESDRVLEAFYLTDQETADHYWRVVFSPSAILFLVSVVFLLPGIFVAYSPSTKHRCLRVVENTYLASKRGGVRCLSILNAIFAAIYCLLAIFLGSNLLTLVSSCSSPLFWCYEITAWGLAILYGGTAYLLGKKASMAMDEADLRGQNMGLEMLEAAPFEVVPDTTNTDRRVREGFKTWMGSTLLSSDSDEDEDDDEPDNNPQSANPIPRQRL